MSADPSEYYEHYRDASLGQSLMETLDALINSHHITPYLARKVLAHFDRALATELSSDSARLRVQIKGHLHQYNSVDEVYKFNVTDAVITVKQANGVLLNELELSRLPIIACKSKREGA